MTKVTISRFWHNPAITTTFTDKLINIEIDLDDFMKALKEEIGSVTWTFKQETFEKQLDEAVAVVLKKVKQETIKVI